MDIQSVCRFCDEKFPSVAVYVNHLKLHRNICSTFPCCITSCTEVFNSESYLRTHLSRHHALPTMRRPSHSGNSSHSASNEVGKYICTVAACHKELDTFRKLTSHLREHISKGIAVSCPFLQCEVSKSFKNSNSFSVHVSRYHKHSKAAAINQVIQSDQVDAEANLNNDDNFNNFNNVADHGPFDVPPAFPEVNVDGEIHLDNLAQFFMKLEFQYLLPASTVQFIAKELKTLKVETYDFISLKLKKSLTRENIRSEIVDLILKDVFNTHKKHLETLRTSHTRKAYYKKKYEYVTPRRVRLKGNKFFYYVSVIETLKRLFKNKSFTIDLDAPESSDPKILKDFTDGSCYKANIFFKENDKCLRIVIYQDAFELVCPIGPAKKKHKTIGVYLSVLNLPTWRRSKVDNIFLIALCKDTDYDHEGLFRPIVDDLKVLESQGVFIPGHGMVKGGLAFIAGDNLGSHCLGGFYQSFSRTRYFCRYCSIDNKSFHADDGHHLKFPRRTPDMYDNCLLGRNIDTRMGVKLNSIFNELTHYHVCGPGGLPCCLGHDLHEGLAAVDMAWFVYYFITNGWFTEEQLTSKINSFPYTKEDRRDKPIPYKCGNEKISGGAFQIWNFIRLFPLIVLDIVDDWPTKWEDPVWKNYMLLVEIMELIMAPEVHVDVVSYLDGLIHEYLDARRENFPDVPLRPKHHYLTHYPEFLLELGPLSKVWTLRFESKHQYFKRTIRGGKNFINVLKSLTIKHELSQAFLRTGAQLQLEVDPSHCSDFNANMYAEALITAVQQSGASLSCEECAVIVIRGTSYVKGSLVVVRQTHYQYEVEIGRICLILYESNSKVYFLLEVFSTVFDHCTRAFKLGSRLRYECILQSKLLTYSTAREYCVSGSSFIKLKYGIYS